MFEDAAMIGKFDGAAAAVIVVVTTGSSVDFVNIKVDDVIVIVCGIDVFTKDRERKKKTGKRRRNITLASVYSTSPFPISSSQLYSLSKKKGLMANVVLVVVDEVVGSSSKAPPSSARGRF